MDIQLAIDITKQALELALIILAPPILANFVTGLIFSILQTATQINEMTLTFVPKIIATLVALFISGPWALQKLVEFYKHICTLIPNIIY
jgi:flagellar biosynthetic protein FliQ